jgi:hypothetical protein
MGEKDPNLVLVFGGNSGVLINGIQYASESNSCIRNIYLRADGVQQPIDFRAKITFGIGNLIEEEYGNLLISQGHKVEKGVRVRKTIIPDLGGKVCEMWDETDLLVDGVPFEIKSISSTSMYERVFLKDEYKWDNLIQALHHMIMHKSYEGKLVYISTIYHSKTFKKESVRVSAGDVKIFNLKFDSNGRAFVNGVDTPIYTKHLIKWREWALASLAYREWRVKCPEYYGKLLLQDSHTDVNPVCRYCNWKKECESSSSYLEFLEKCRDKVKTT